jgi:microcystin-dependent protein
MPRKPLPNKAELLETLHRTPETDKGGRREKKTRPPIGGTYVSTDASGKVRILTDDDKQNPPAQSKAYPVLIPPPATLSPTTQMVQFDLPGLGQSVVAFIGTLNDVATVPVGVVLPYFGGAAPAGFLLMDGSTIGDVSSGATRANADTQKLFEHLWNNSRQSELAILTSTGAASTRGASATADFNAHKRMPLPDMRQRMPYGKQASAFVGQTGGEETHTLTTNEIPAHQHGLPVAGGGAATNGFAAGGAAGFSGSYVTDLAGGGQAHNNMPPYMVMNFIIKM